MKERRNEDVVWLAKFLVNPDTILKDDKISGRKPVKSTCINLTNKLAKRLISKDNEKEEDEEAAASDESQNLSKKQLLQRLMKDALLEQPGREVPKSLAHNLKMFEVTRERTEIVEVVYQAVLSAKHTSVESERSFSVGGSFATKVRSRLSDRALSSLVFLKLHFKALQ